MDGNSHFPFDMEPFPAEEENIAQQISVEQIKHLVSLIDRSDISELELKRAKGETRLVLRKLKTQVNSALPAGVQLSSSSSPSGTEETGHSETKQTIVAPLVGIFHVWAKPKGGALVAVGDTIKTGQLIATIQSLNVINEVESTVAGRVVEILVQDGQPVEYGQPIMTIDIAEGA